MSIYDTVMGGTAGVVWRAATGTVDPWTKQQIIDDETANNIQAGASPDTAATQAQNDVTNTLSTFSLGGTDPVGADPSQAKLSLPSSQALKDTWKSMTNDDGTGCGITNLAGCYPSWLPYAAAGILVIALLWVLRPYVELAEE